MKYAIITQRDLRYKGVNDGEVEFIRNLAKYLADSRNQVHIFSADPDAKIIQQDEDIHLHLVSGQKKKGVISYRQDNTIKYPAIKRDSDSFAQSFLEQRLETYDVVNIFHMNNAFGFYSQEPLLFDPGKTILFPMLLGKEYEKFLDKVDAHYLAAEKRVLKSSLHIQTPSKAEARMIIEDYDTPRNQVFTSPRGYCPGQFKPRVRNSLNPKKIEVLCANLVQPQKGQKMFLSIVQEAQKHDINLIVNLAGFSEKKSDWGYSRYQEEFIYLVKQFDLGSHFRFHGPLKQSELSRLMDSVDLALYPSVWESFGKAPLESVSTGIPTIVFDDVPAFQEFMEHGETGIILPRQAERVVEAIEDLIGHPSRIRHISEQGIGQSKAFTWDAVLESLMDNYEERGLK